MHYKNHKRYVNLTELIEAIEQKWKFRGKKLTDVREEFLRKKHV